VPALTDAQLHFRLHRSLCNGAVHLTLSRCYRLARSVHKGTGNMAKKTTGKLALRTETLRQLSNTHLAAVAGAIASGTVCLGDQNTRFTNSTDPHPIYDEYTRYVGYSYG